MKLAFGGAFKQLRIHVPSIARGHVGLFQDLANALEGDGERLEVFGLADGLQRNQTLLGIHQVIGPRTKNGADFVVAEAFPFAKNKLGAVENEVQDLRLLVRRYAALGLVSEERLCGSANRERERERQF